MSKPKRDGGAAFPGGPFKYTDSQGRAVTDERSKSSGMSLRDWFAGQAMAGFHWVRTTDDEPDQSPLIARDCYVLADAMLNEREKS